ADQPTVDQDQDREIVHQLDAKPFAVMGLGNRREAPRSQRQRRCTHNHCSGCSRTHASTTDVIACIVPSMSILPAESRAGSMASVRSMRKRWRSDKLMIRVPCIG